MTESKRREGEHLPNKFLALLPVLVLLALMVMNTKFVFGWTKDPHIYVLIAACVCCFVGYLCKVPIKEMLAAGFDAVSQSLEAMFILLFVGCLVGSFEWCGTIPALVFYGLKLFTPAIFLPAVCLLCAIVGLSLGSSYTVSATLGIAFMSIGATMGINPALIAGAVLSGACTGDKFSPLSDSTNLSAASAQTGLFDHVRAMVATTFPAFVIAFLGYCVLSLTGNAGTYDPEMVKGLSDAIQNNFTYMSPVLLLPVLAIIVVAVVQIPAVPGVILVSFIGCVFAVIFQGASFADCIQMVHYGYSVETDNELANTLMNRGGMNSMLWTINMALIAIGFGGMYSRSGAVEALLGNMIKRIKTPFHMCAAIILTAMFCILTMCDQYLGLIIPAGMYKEKVDDMGLSRNLLSRCQEDGGTLFSPLVPWSSCGVYHAGMLGVSTISYLPFCFTNILNPIISLLTASWGGNIIFADGSRTGFFGGKIKEGKVAGAPEEAHEHAMQRLGELREQGHIGNIGEKIHN